MNIQKINYKNNELNIEINCYVNKKNQIWFRGKEIALILEYKDTKEQSKIAFMKMIKKLINFKIKQNSRGDFLSPRAESLEKNINLSL